MAFRANEAESLGYTRARDYLLPISLSEELRSAGERILLDIVDKVGPVVDSYPTWHPLVSKHDDRHPCTRPAFETGYRGLDHTIYFAHGFLSCPYVTADPIFESAESMTHHCATISAEEINFPFYAEGARPVLVTCEWSELLSAGHYVPKRLAVPLMMEKELPCWKWAQRAERWESLRHYLLGSPHGNRSSLFVEQDTAVAMKRVYTAMVESGMFGPLKMG